MIDGKKVTKINKGTESLDLKIKEIDFLKINEELIDENLIELEIKEKKVKSK